MAINYTLPSDAIVFTDDSLTEQEHKDSCDINLMLKNAVKGLDVRGRGTELQYGYDDITMDSMTFLQEKQRLEKELKEISEASEFTPEELAHFPKEVVQKFNLKAKKAPNKKNDPNDINNSEPLAEKKLNYNEKNDLKEGQSQNPS